jgi:hypothetical protein
MIRIPSDLLGFLRTASRDISSGVRPALAFEFDDNTFEAYGEDAFVFMATELTQVPPEQEQSKLEPVETDDVGTPIAVYRVTREQGHARAQALGEANQATIVFNGDELLREYGKE